MPLTLKHPRPVVAVAASRDQIATADAAGAVVLWDAHTGKETQTVLAAKDKGNPVTRLRFSPDGDWLYLVTDGGTKFHVCECKKPKQVQVFASGSSKSPWTVLGIGQETPRWIITPNNKDLLLYGGATDASGPLGSPDQRFAQRAMEHRNRITHLAATDSLIITVAGGVLHGWPAERDPKAWKVTLLGIEPTSIALSANGEWVAVTGDEGEVRVFDAANGQPTPKSRGHKLAVWSAAFSPDGTRLVTASEDKTARVWDVRTGTEMFVLKGHTSAVNAVAVTPDGKRIATGSEDKTVRVWTRNSGTASANPGK